MPDDHATLLAEAARVMGRTTTLDDTRRLIVSSALRVLPEFEHIGLSVRPRGGLAETDSATTDLVGVLDALQHEVGEGPGVEALGGSATIAAPHLRHEQRWHLYVPMAVQLGLRAQMAVQLCSDRDGTVVGLNLYSTSRDAIPDQDVRVAELFATHAALALENARRIMHLDAAIHSRQEIGTAVGVLMERHHLDRESATALLWRASSQRNIKVRVLAARLVGGP